MMTNKKLGIPYMGSKRGIAKNIIDFVKFENPNAKYFYDLFGGGGAMSFQALTSFQHVYYNELNTGVVKLLEKIRDDGITSEFYKWISREEFNELKGKDTWQAGLAKTCWSFGNKQRDYLFGKENENDKRLLHEIIVNLCQNSINEFATRTGLKIDVIGLEDDTINNRRLKVMKIIKKELGRKDIQQLQQLEQLEQLQRLERLERLIISNKSYLDVAIDTPIDETIIYLDPPYFGTEKYQNDLCHTELINFIKNSPYKIYVSSYEFDLPCVLEIKKRSTLSATVNNAVIEKLFCNKFGDRI